MMLDSRSLFGWRSVVILGLFQISASAELSDTRATTGRSRDSTILLDAEDYDVHDRSFLYLNPYRFQEDLSGVSGFPLNPFGPFSPFGFWPSAGLHSTYPRNRQVVGFGFGFPSPFGFWPSAGYRTTPAKYSTIPATYLAKPARYVVTPVESTESAQLEDSKPTRLNKIPYVYKKQEQAGKYESEIGRTDDRNEHQIVGQMLNGHMEHHEGLGDDREIHGGDGRNVHIDGRGRPVRREMFEREAMEGMRVDLQQGDYIRGSRLVSREEDMDPITEHTVLESQQPVMLSSARPLIVEEDHTTEAVDSQPAVTSQHEGPVTQSCAYSCVNGKCSLRCQICHGNQCQDIYQEN